MICDSCKLPQTIGFDGVIHPVYEYKSATGTIYRFHPRCAREFSFQNAVMLFYDDELCFDNGESTE